MGLLPENRSDGDPRCPVYDRVCTCACGRKVNQSSTHESYSENKTISPWSNNFEIETLLNIPGEFLSQLKT